MRRVALGVMVMVVATRAPARASGIVFEAYTGNRPPGMGAVMRPALDELEERGFVAQPESVSRALGDRAPRPGIENPDMSSDAIAREVAAGINDWQNGDFENAAQKLTVALLAVHTNPALVIRSTDHRQIADALVGLAMSLARQGDHAGAEAAIAEFVRSFPDLEVSRASFGPEAVKLYKAVKESLNQQGRGSLAISVSEPSATIFLDETYRGIGTYQNGDLLPGRYRVYVQTKDAGRRYDVEVKANDQTRLDVDWSIDPMLTTSRDWAGFLFTTTDQTAHQGDYAVKVARETGQGGYVVVLSMGDVDGTPAIAGRAYQIETGQLARAGVVALTNEQSTTESMRMLARFLSGDQPGPGVKVIEDRLAAPAQRAERDEPHHRRTWLKWVAAPSAVAAFSASAYLFSIDGKQTCGDPPCAKVYESTPGAYASAGVGVLLTGLTLYLLIEEHRHRRSTTLVAVPARGGAIASVSWEF